MVKCLTPIKVHNAAKNLLVNLTPLSMRRYVGMLQSTSQWLKKKFALCVEVVLDVGIAHLNLE